jgi:hypothetical protein
MRLYFTVIFLAFSFIVNCQRVHFNLFTGIANYKGDLQYNPKGGKQMSFKQPKFAAGAGIEYELLDKLNLRLAITSGKIHADDKRQPGQEQRNLNFTSSIFDVMFGAQYYILNPEAYIASPYIFVGAAYFHFNPYTYTTAGEKVFLKPLSTEGQGFVTGKEPYNLSQFAFPFGGGVKLSLSDDVRIGIEISLRKTSTDYLDDVSTTYVDENLLLANRGQMAVNFAYRGNEVNGGGSYPAEGTPRGTLAAKDWYYFTGITASLRLGNGGGGRSSGRKSKLGCPAIIR